jgi:hypothetical protein
MDVLDSLVFQSHNLSYLCCTSHVPQRRRKVCETDEIRHSKPLHRRDRRLAPQRRSQCEYRPTLAPVHIATRPSALRKKSRRGRRCAGSCATSVLSCGPRPHAQPRIADCVIAQKLTETKAPTRRTSNSVAHQSITPTQGAPSDRLADLQDRTVLEPERRRMSRVMAATEWLETLTPARRLPARAPEGRPAGTA